MKKVLLIILFFVSFQTYSQEHLDLQEQFELISKTESGLEYFVKIDKWNADTSTFSIWLKVLKPKIIVKNNKGKLISKGGGSQISFMNFHLNDKLYDDLDYVIYDSKGILVDSGNHMNYSLRVFPETIAETILNYLN